MEGQKEGICEKHGKYTSYPLVLFDRVISMTSCPICQKEEEDREEAKAAAYQKMMKEADLMKRGVEPEFFNATLENYKAESPAEKEALEAARALKEGAIKKLVLLGSNGVGKTHLASALAKDLNGARITMFELSAKIRASYANNECELDVLDRYLARPFLCIDEIGRTKGSDAERNWMSYLLDKAHARGIRVMLISNRHTAKQLPPDRKNEAFENFIDNDVISRLRVSSKIVEVTGRDRRAAAATV